MMRKIYIFTVFYVLSCSVCFGDVIYLKNGGKMEGVVIENKRDGVLIQLNVGTVTFDYAKIERIDEWMDEDNQALKDKWLIEKTEQEKTTNVVNNIKSETNEENSAPKKSEEAKEEESPKAKYIFEPIAILPANRRSSTENIGYRSLLGKVESRKLRKDPEQIYYIYLPEKYSPAREWPLFIGVHAYTCSGQDTIPIWQEYADNENFILVCPTFSNGYQRLEDAADNRMIDIIEEVEKDFSIDKKKILIAGFSGGAQFTHRFVLKHPEYINSASIMAAGSYDYPQRSRKAEHIKFLVGVGNKDIPRIELSKTFAKQLEDNGYQVKFEIFQGVAHEVSPAQKEMTIDLFRNMMNSKDR
ncbi:MAG: hypothetical protein ABH836_02630 [Candidatus Omnitrophota bacterium]